MAYFYTELAIFSLAVTVTIASTHFAYPQRDGQTELAWVAWTYTMTVLMSGSLISVLTQFNIE